MWLCSLIDLVPGKENPNLGKLELRLLFFALFYFFPSSARTSHSLAVTLWKEDQVEFRGERPNRLNAGATLANGDRECQYYF